MILCLSFQCFLMILAWNKCLELVVPILFLAAIGTDVFDMEKPVVFTYEEILSSTDGFSDSNLLGHGTYGSVYYGVLHDQVCNHLLWFQ